MGHPRSHPNKYYDQLIYLGIKAAAHIIYTIQPIIANKNIKTKLTKKSLKSDETYTQVGKKSHIQSN